MTAQPRAKHVGLVVEGSGDLGAVPLLLRNYLHSIVHEFRDVLGRPVSANSRSNADKVGGIERLVGIAAARPGCVGILVVLDGDDDAVCQHGPELQVRASGVCRVPVYVSLAETTFEDWIYASAETLDLGIEYSGKQRGQKEIKKALRPNTYAKPVWQPRLTGRIDIARARGRSASLNRMLKRFDELLLLL